MVPESDFERVNRLKQDGDLVGAKELLWRIADETEAVGLKEGWGIAPWAYEQLAIIYRKERDREKEKLVLERLASVTDPQGVTLQNLLERLQRIREYPQTPRGL
jgi:hypothetical protein